MSDTHATRGPGEQSGLPATSVRANPKAFVFGTVAALCVGLLGLPIHLVMGSTVGMAGDLVSLLGMSYALWRYRRTQSTEVLARIVFPTVVLSLALADLSWGGYGPTALVWPTVTVIAAVWLHPRALHWLSGAILAFVTVEGVLLATGVLRADAPPAIVWIISTWIEITAITLVSTVVGSWVYRAMQTEAELLAERSEAYRSTVGELGVGVWEVDLATGDSQVSEQVASLLGIRSGLVSEDDARAWMESNFADEDVVRLRAVVKELMRGGQPRELEIEVKGRFPAVWLRLRVKTDEGPDGVLIRAAVQDISAARLRDQRRTNFMAMMSHELRTPLAGLLGSAELLRGARLDVEHARYLETILRAGDHIRGVFDELLDFTRIESGVVELSEESVDIRALLAAVVDLFAVTALDKDLELSLWVAPHVPEQIQTDPVRLQQVVVNVVSNALKYTERGEVAVRAEVERGALHVSVADTGVGIEPHDLELVFDAYERGRYARGTGPRGQGLGLAISRKIVERLGGTIGVTSAVGQGSTFVVTLPGVEARDHWQQPLEGRFVDVRDLPDATARVVTQTLLDAGASLASDAETIAPEMLLRIIPATDVERPHISIAGGTAASPPQLVPIPVLQSELIAACKEVLGELRRYATGPTPPIERIQPLRVLLVEDDPINQEITRLLMERDGHQVDVASDGQEAVARAGAGGYALVLMDLSLPKLSGLEAIHQIRARGCQAKVVAFTADARPVVAREAAEAGADDVLFKPASVDALRALLAQTRLAPLERSTEAEER